MDTVDARRGNWMQTYTGRQFWPLDPRPEEIDILDIAHALSMQCRYAGHCRRFYSVAEHSVLLSHMVLPKNALWALLHDASEAYLVDVPRPVKPALSNYKAIESHVMAAICRRFRIKLSMPEEVDDADNHILKDEFQQNMARPPAPLVDFGPALGVTLRFWSPGQAQEEFLARFEELVAL